MAIAIFHLWISWCSCIDLALEFPGKSQVINVNGEINLVKPCQTSYINIEYFLQNKDDEALKIVRRIFYENKGADSMAKFSVRKLVSEVSMENRLNRNKGL